LEVKRPAFGIEWRRIECSWCAHDDFVVPLDGHHKSYRVGGLWEIALQHDHT
jgi:hypothetical protein